MTIPLDLMVYMYVQDSYSLESFFFIQQFMMNISVMGWQHRAYMVFLDGYLYAILWSFSFWFDTNFCMSCKRNLMSLKCSLFSLDFDSQDCIYYLWLSTIIKLLKVCNLNSILIFAYFLLDRGLNPPQVTIPHGFCVCVQ